MPSRIRARNSSHSAPARPNISEATRAAGQRGQDHRPAADPVGQAPPDRREDQLHQRVDRRQQADHDRRGAEAPRAYSGSSGMTIPKPIRSISHRRSRRSRAGWRTRRTATAPGAVGPVASPSPSPPQARQGRASATIARSRSARYSMRVVEGPARAQRCPAAAGQAPREREEDRAEHDGGRPGRARRRCRRRPAAGSRRPARASRAGSGAWSRPRRARPAASARRPRRSPRRRISASAQKCGGVQ